MLFQSHTIIMVIHPDPYCVFVPIYSMTNGLRRQFDIVDDSKAEESTFRASNEDWRLTSSFIDASSFVFTSLTNQTPGYCTPSTGGNGTYYHNKAGDLHTPNPGFHLGTPLSLPHSDRNLTATTFDMHGFQPNFLEPNGFQSSNHFGAPETFPPNSFLHQDSGFDTMDDTTPGLQTIAGNAMTQQSKVSTFPPQFFGASMSDSALKSKDK